MKHDVPGGLGRSGWFRSWRPARPGIRASGRRPARPGIRASGGPLRRPGIRATKNLPDRTFGRPDWSLRSRHPRPGRPGATIGAIRAATTVLHRAPVVVVALAVALTVGLALGLSAGPAAASTAQTAAQTATAATAQPAPPLPALTTPVLSIRRVPTFVATSVASEHLSTSLTKILANPALHQGVAQSCLQVTQDGRTLFSAQPTQELLPASNLKLLTATAALDKLGPDSRITTPVEADRAAVGGVISGNLYLVGAGDPLLRTPDFVASLVDPEPTYTSLTQLAAQVRAAGVTRVSGSVVADESRYDALRGVPTWSPSYLADGVVGPLSAVDVDDGFATFGGGGGVPSPQPAVEAATQVPGRSPGGGGPGRGPGGHRHRAGGAR